MSKIVVDINVKNASEVFKSKGGLGGQMVGAFLSSEKKKQMVEDKIFLKVRESLLKELEDNLIKEGIEADIKIWKEAF
ncbi:MAG: hypothetical protein LAT68_02850 [Cyclobacteriaceae bacterium]|nr:hypothetical protein [Cyclobacteriaceae bacterium]MCH8515244.1 hypothetical protein [Cyclobacteriaceae bacterium]